jgi:hypothetical protein
MGWFEYLYPPDGQFLHDRNRRSNASSVFPENMEPQITSIRPLQ